MRLTIPFAFSALAIAACSGTPPAAEHVATSADALDTLNAVASFGSNPGNLLMFSYVPASVPANAPLVVVLHGCTEMATDMAGAGWNDVADVAKFYVVYPQQQSANNPENCFNWMGNLDNPSDHTGITRDTGEALSIKQMVDQMKADYSIDASRVFVAGFSAGGAMAAVMLADYPDVFTAGGIDAGIPYGCPMTSVLDPFTCMSPGKPQTPSFYGQAVIAADPGWSGTYPRVTIWQGSADTTVSTNDETELIKEWTDVNGLSQTPTATTTVDGQARSTYADSSGNVLVESWVIAGMPHGFATDPSNGCGTAGLYTPDENICTSLHMAEFWGIASTPAGGGDSVSASGPSSGNGAGSGGGSATGSIGGDAAADPEGGIASTPADGGGASGSRPSSGSGAGSGGSAGSSGDGAVAVGGGSGTGGGTGSGTESAAAASPEGGSSGGGGGCSVGRRPSGGSAGFGALALLLGLVIRRRSGLVIRRRGRERKAS